MSRWITPRPCACSSASTSAIPISIDLLVAQRIGGDQLGEGVAVDQLGDQVEGVLLGACLVQGDDRGMRQTGGGERLAGGALAILAGGKRDHLDGDLAVEQLVVSAPHHPEAAGAEALEQAVATRAPERPAPAAGRSPRARASMRLRPRSGAINVS